MTRKAYKNSHALISKEKWQTIERTVKFNKLGISIKFYSLESCILDDLEVLLT